MTVLTSRLMQLEVDLGAMPKADQALTRNDNLVWLDRLAAPTVMTSLLDEILADRFALAQVAARSYRHTNNFDKIVLVDSGVEDDYRLTLHMWVPPYTDQEINEEMIHEHRFSFWSAVLTGQLESDNYVEATEGVRFHRFEYTPEVSAEAKFFYKERGDVFLKKDKPFVVNAGESYYMDNVRIHRVPLPEDQTCCTLVLRGPRLRPYAVVYDSELSTKSRDKNEYIPLKFTSDECRAKLEYLRELLVQRMAQPEGAQ